MPPQSGSLLFNSVTDQAQPIPVVGADGASYNVQTRMFRPTSPILTLNDPFLSKTGGSAVSSPLNLLYISPDHVAGDVWKWNFDIQRELPDEMVLTAAYIGTRAATPATASATSTMRSPRPTPTRRSAVPISSSTIRRLRI
jgi:hypothetical protein